LSKITDDGLADFAAERFRTEHPEEYKRREAEWLKRVEGSAAATFPLPPSEPSQEEIDRMFLT